MLKNYSSLMTKDSKFKENSMIGCNGENGTPFVQYLIKNNKYQGDQGGRRG